MHRFNPNVLLKKTYWYTLNDCLEHWLVNALGLLIGPCADWSRKFISNPDWQLCYVKRTLSPLFGFASEIGVSFRGSFCVRLGSAQGLLCVRSGSALADPDRTLKANPRAGLGPLSVRLGPVGTVYPFLVIYRCCIPNLVKISSVVLESNRLFMKTDIGPLSDSGDLKMYDNPVAIVVWLNSNTHFFPFWQLFLLLYQWYQFLSCLMFLLKGINC